MQPLPIRLLMLCALLCIVAPNGAKAASLTLHVVDGSNAPLGDAVVYALPRVASKKAPAPAEIAQVARQFQPSVTVVQTGASISFPNRDTVRHQVYSFSPAKIFEMKLYSGLPSTPLVFEKSGLIVLGCNIHDSMVAYVLVVDTPYFGKSGASGNVQIELPAGDYALSVWHPRIAEQAPPQAIVVTGDQKIDQVVRLKS